MNQPAIPRPLTLLALAALLAATRLGGDLGTSWPLPDASWAVFFLAGFAFASRSHWALPALLGAAIGLDVFAIAALGARNYCVTLAYWCNLPAYALLWFGGVWLRGHVRHDARDLGRLLVSLTISASACYLFTNGSYYWLGAVRHPTLWGWSRNLADWYVPFLLTTATYVGLAALLHWALARARSRHALPTR
jgi:hypothetical protein